MTNNTTEIPAEQQVLNHINDNGQKLSWLAEKVGISVGHLHSILKGEGTTKRDLTPDNLEKINLALRTTIK